MAPKEGADSIYRLEITSDSPIRYIDFRGHNGIKDATGSCITVDYSGRYCPYGRNGHFS